MKKLQRGFIPLFILIVVAVIAIGGGAYYVNKNKTVAKEEQGSISNENSVTESTSTNATSTSIKATSTSGVIIKTPVATTTVVATGQLKLDFATYSNTTCMYTGCKPDYSPQSVKHLVLKVGDTFGTAQSYESGTLFKLVQFDSSKIVVKTIAHVSPFVNENKVNLNSDSTFTFSNSACFTLNNLVDSVPKFCLARTNANTNLNFDVISKVSPQ